MWVTEKLTDLQKMKNRHFIYTTSFLAASLAAAQAQTTIADWDFDAGGTIAAPYNAPSATTGSGSATQLGMSNGYTFANGEGPGSTANCDVLASSGASTGSGSFGWRVRGNSNTANAGAGMANGWNSAAPIGTQGAEFSVNTSMYTGITLTFDLNATGQAERNLAVEYTLDDTQATPTWLNTTITSAGSLGTLANNTTSANTITGNYVELSGGGTGWNNQIAATFASGAANDPNFAFEIVNASTGADDVNTGGTALNNSSGNWRYDNVLLSGVSTVPEPGMLVLAGLGGLMTLVTLRKSRKA
jgi:hypothetical protein